MPSSSNLHTLWDIAVEGSGQAAAALALERWMDAIRALAVLCDAEGKTGAGDPGAEDEVQDDGNNRDAEKKAAEEAAAGENELVHDFLAQEGLLEEFGEPGAAGKHGAAKEHRVAEEHGAAELRDGVDNPHLLGELQHSVAVPGGVLQYWNGRYFLARCRSISMPMPPKRTHVRSTDRAPVAEPKGLGAR